MGRFRSDWNRKDIAIAADPDTNVDALIRLQVACNLALEALPALPDETERALRDHVQALCDVTVSELVKIKPGWRSRLSAGSVSD